MNIRDYTTLIPELHLQQIGLFLFKKGIEIFSLHKDEVLSSFLKAMWKYNKMALYLNDIWRTGAISGEVLLYIKPVDNKYRILYYSADQFDPEYDSNFDLLSVTISSDTSDFVPQTEIVKIGKDKIEVWYNSSIDVPADVVMDNPYGFLPCVLIQNNPVIGTRSEGEFDRFEKILQAHNYNVEQLNSNLEFFGSPIFYSTRSKSEMIEAGMIDERYSVSSEGGYRSPVGVRTQKIKARRIFAGLEENERLGFETPTAVDSSMVEYVENSGEELRMAMGGVPDLSIISSTASLFDYQYRYSQAYVTASRKALAYIEHGIVQAFEVMRLMANFDGVIPSSDNEIKWRHLGEVFPDTVNNTLTKSIVSRNLLRLGVGLEGSIRHIFPDKTDEEIRELLRGGFAYELVDGVATIASKLSSYDNIDMSNYINELIDSEVNNESRKFGE